MCFGGGGGDGGAAQIAAQTKADEAARQAKIIEGRANIDKSFEQYNPAYYDQYKKAYTDYYNPQIDQQYGRSVDELTAVLAGKGLLESTAGAEKFGRLAQTAAEQRTAKTNEANDAANTLQTKVESGKNDLYNLNQAAADPAAINARALASASSFAAPQAFSPIGNLFASTLSPLTSFQSADANSVSPQLPWNQNKTSLAGTTGSGKVT